MSSTELCSGQIQNIKFCGTESEFVTELHGEIVNVQCGEGNHNHGSSKVKLTDRIDYNWEFKYYHGHLVAAHIKGKIIAYAMKGKDGGMIRVVHQETNGKRTLIKNLKDDIKDLAFSYSTTEIILGCVDAEGNILVYNIEDTADSLNYTLLLHVFHETPSSVKLKPNFRLAWCPYVPGIEEDLEMGDECEKMFVVLNGTKAEIYNVATLNGKYGNKGPIDPDNGYDGYTEINHRADLVDASFSSDGCAIALASQDGFVQFFQLFMYNETQKCLHEWIPHEGKSLTSVMFVDNILEYTTQCWKFAITGAEKNTELKLWSCESWSCLQTINFLPNPKGVIMDLFFNVAVDYSGKYLLISDINNRSIYILELQKNEKSKLMKGGVLANFLVPAPFLSFHILEAGTRNIPYCFNNSAEDLYNEEGYEDEAEICVQNLKMLIIQPKKFQECNVTFQPETLMHKGVVVTKSEVSSFEESNIEENESKSQSIEKIPDLDELQNSVTLLIQQQQQQQQTNTNKLTLMTPDDFTSPGKSSKPNSIRNSITNESNIIDTSDINDEELVCLKGSGGSSPSREVQEIFSRNNSSSGFLNQEFYNSLANLEVKDEKCDGSEYEEILVDSPLKSRTTSSAEKKIIYDSLTWPKIASSKNNESAKQIKDSSSSSNEINKHDLETVYLRMNGLETIIKEQSLMIQQLHKDVKTLNHSVVNNSIQNPKKDSLDIGKEIETVMSKQHLHTTKILENLIQLQKAKNVEFQESIITLIGQMLPQTISENVPRLLQNEIKHSILPSLHQSMEAYRLQIDVQFNQKLATIDALAKDSFAKVLSSKSLIEALSASVANLLMPTLEKSYKFLITQTLVPSVERVSGQMFQQINETFTRGTKEYIAALEASIERQNKTQEKNIDLIVENLKINSTKLRETLAVDLQKQINTIFKTIPDNLMLHMEEFIGSELKNGFKTQASVIEEGVLNAVSRSRAVTPAPHVDSHVQMITHIQQAISKGTFDEAFQIALSAENLQLVIFVCERVDVNKIFDGQGQCILSQSCLLALLQQLSMELHKNTEVKLKYIQAAFLALLPDLPQTRQFIPKVLKDLIKQLTIFMKSNPPLKQMTEARLTKMAVESLLNAS